jgi:hypothetical protein
VRTAVVSVMALSGIVLACASAPTSGPLGEGFSLHPAITSTDTAHPPRSAWIDLDKEQYVALLLVTPGRGVTLLYPRDSVTDNHLSAGAHQLAFNLTATRDPTRSTVDSLNRARRRPVARDTVRSVTEQRGMAQQAAFDTFLLLVTSPQPLVYSRVREKIVGVSIPIENDEALNAVAKAVKSTLIAEPREWAAFYRQVALTPDR